MIDEDVDEEGPSFVQDEKGDACRIRLERLTQRDVFPLPRFRVPEEVRRAGDGRGQRRCRTRQLYADANRCVDSLNRMYAKASDAGSEFKGVRPTAMQQLV